MPTMTKYEGTRRIYWRVTCRGTSVYTGVYTDLKTFKGVTNRLMRKYPTWVEVEARNEPFGKGV